ncbi:hypothetical protein K1F50_20455 [Muricauda oceani]|uniref:hypothetical protein n=1 Tax=Flagellimonas oceani TaxID=2698672 RepID=UPI001C662E89|nr:hypothetical protein [Allomuricauda oceani]MBW8245187.1 hypothetical protein [Allomuricauda oceani]
MEHQNKEQRDNQPLFFLPKNQLSYGDPTLFALQLGILAPLGCSFVERDRKEQRENQCSIRAAGLPNT